jgi:putative FmdB family regulatory protein
MPVYEFRCQDCQRLVQLSFSFAEYGELEAICPHCQGKNLKRRIRRVALAKSEETRMDTLMDDSALSGLDEEDPRSVGRFMRRMSQEMGEDLGDEFSEVVDRLESGESPESIEESMPDLGGGDGLGDDFG